MPTFWQQPLTWLFLAATACLNAVVIASWRESEWYDAFLLGQMLVAAGWLVVGQSHRLARFAVALGALLGVVAPDYYDSLRFMGTPRVWEFVLGAYVYLFTMTAGATWITACLTRTPCGDARSVARWQFPLAEIFGWTTIAAILAAILPHVKFWSLLEAGDGMTWFAVWCALPIFAGAYMGAALPVVRSDGAATKWAMNLVMAGLAALLIAVDPRMATHLFVAFCYVAAWIIVQHMDLRLMRPPDAEVGEPSDFTLRVAPGWERPSPR